MSVNIGELNRRLTFQQRGENSWDDMSSHWAKIVYLRGTEKVLEGRMVGRNTVVITVRQTSKVKSATTAWRIKFKGSGEVFNIRSLIPSSDRQFVDITCETQV
jgi:SPP1 family predicted phage head-tail adaptor